MELKGDDYSLFYLDAPAQILILYICGLLVYGKIESLFVV